MRRENARHTKRQAGDRAPEADQAREDLRKKKVVWWYRRDDGIEASEEKIKIKIKIKICIKTFANQFSS